MISIPSALANSRTSPDPSNTVGIPTTSSVPSTAPVGELMPPTTAIDRMSSDSVGGNWVGWLVELARASSPPASAAMPPERPNAISFTRIGATVYDAAVVSFSRTAMSERPTPVRRSRVTRSSTMNVNARQR
jgi:hypothetical protein